MRQIRIHIDGPLQVGTEIALPPQAAAHAARVLRLRSGDFLTLFNGDGQDYPAELVEVDARAVRARVLAAQPPANESPLRIVLAQALARGEKMDWIVQKATELGAAAIVPLLTERSEVKLDDARGAKRVAHWRAVAISACEQSGRATIPSIDAPRPLETWLASRPADSDAMRLVLHPGSGGVRPREMKLTAPCEVSLAVGPEGGFGERDLAALRDAGFRALSLGPRILRTETAGLAAIAALQALYGDA